MTAWVRPCLKTKQIDDIYIYIYIYIEREREREKEQKRDGVGLERYYARPSSQF
jgi:hypothetical protein